MAHFLVIYATTEGHTRKVAEHIANTTRAQGHDASTWDSAAREASPPDLSSYDAVIIGASVHAGTHQQAVAEFVAARRQILNAMPSVFFSVSLHAALADEESQNEAQRYATDFLEESGWTPDETWTVAGALLYTQYNFFKRLLMKLMAGRGGHPTDTSQDYEYTDWEALDRQVASFVDQVAASEDEYAPGP